MTGRAFDSAACRSLRAAQSLKGVSGDVIVLEEVRTTILCQNVA